MRFAYIDSQGKEVGIPSVEALGLRIELGAITPSTQLYDATADRWAPASEHEVFRTLSREIQEKGEGTFVAPPPPPRTPVAPPPQAPPAEPPASGPPEKKRAPNPFDMMDGPRADVPEPEAPPEEAPAGAGRDEGEGGEGGFGLGFDLTLAEPEEPSGGAPDAGDEPAAPPAAAESADEGFDFGGMESLEVEGSSLSDEDEAGSATFSGESLELEDMLAASYGDEEPPAPAPAPKGPGSLWGDDDEEEDDDVPAWARDDGGDEAQADDPEAEEARLRGESERRRAAARARFQDDGEAVEAAPTARTGDERRRAAPPPRPTARPARSGVPAGVVGGILLLLVAGGGWFGWSLLQDRRGAAEVEEPAVAIPQIPAELEPRFRELSDAALAATLAEARDLGEERELPEEPPARWLSGEYMANAGDFAAVATYFEALRGWLGAVRGSDSIAFAAAFAAAADSAGIAGEEAELLRRRALAGFSAAGRERRDVYGDLADVLDAATSLHAFLLENQDQIDYEPAASGMSRDPVLEAVPATSAIGDEMWDRVDRITAALDELGALDRVTTELLVDVVLRRIEAAGVR